MAWDLSRVDWQERIRTGRSLMPDLPLLDHDEADRGVAIFDKLRIPDIPGRPLFKEAIGDWFRDIVRAHFGCVVTDPADGIQRRMIREIGLLIAKKNNKTTGGAGLMMATLLANRRPRGEFLLVAPTQDIAELAYGQAEGMIEADDIMSREETGQEGYLKQVLHVQSHKKHITFRGTRQRPGTQTKLRIKTFSEEILTGPRPLGVLIDEVHLLGKDPKAGTIIGQLRGGMVNNLLAFIIMLTTQSTEQPAGLFVEELTKWRAIRDGDRTGATMSIMYEFPDEIAHSKEGIWKDPKYWPWVNPNLGRSVWPELLLQLYDEARQAINAEGKLKEFASQHLNIQIGVTIRSGGWKGAKHWEKNADATLAKAWAASGEADRTARKQARLAEFADLLATCEVVTAGLDGGGLDDLFGLVVLGREVGPEPLEKRRWRLWAHAWCQRTVLAERQDIAPRLLDFERAGDLTIVDDPGDDTMEIADLMIAIEQAGKFPEKAAIGVDQVGTGEVIEELGRREFDITPGLRVIGIPQGWKLNGAIITAERRLAGGRLRHNGSAMMDWVMGNCRIEQRGCAVTITKAISGTAKIDPAIAMLDATILMSLNPEAVSPVSIYETRALMMV